MCLNPQSFRFSYVPCGKCVECRMKRAKEWAYRVTLESSLYLQNCMITLTYNEDNLPPGQTLSIRDYQLFLKRLRKHLEPQRIRYFLCGEYGSKNGRPHYHVIIFNYYPQDAYYFYTDQKGVDLYRSPTIEKLWNKGFVTVGNVTFDTAKYCTLYMQKPPTDGRLKPFVRMSRRPGIGFGIVDPKWLQSDKIYLNGKYIRLPRYFNIVLERQGYSELVKLNKQKRVRDFNYTSTRDFFFNRYNKVFLDDIKKRREKWERIFGLPLDKDGQFDI